ncbi:MAG: transcriptional regulator [Kiloniellales bacterium]|nr:transcriptional regulator [Kiloniellales bacterium]
MPAAPKPRRAAETRSREAILDMLKRRGPLTATEIAETLAVTAMAVRQHLYALQDEALVAYSEQPRPIGRPAKLWRLTEASDRFFPDAHAELTVDLIKGIREAFGAEGMDRLLAIRTRDQIVAYRRRIGGQRSLAKRLEALAEIRSEEGYMAEVRKAEDGTFLLIENHCPVCHAAAACTGLCAAELSVFQAVLGLEVEVSRGDHILAGARRCAYRVAPTARR